MVFGAVALVASLAACGGGGGGSSTPGSNVIPTAGPATNNGNLISPDVFKIQYTGVKSVNDVYTYGSGPLGSPSPNPPSTAIYAVQSTVQAALNAAPSTVPVTGPYLDVNSTELDSSNLASQEFVTDAWVQSSSSGGALEYGTQLMQPLSAEQPNTLTAYVDPVTGKANPQQLDQLPETSGASWTNEPAATISQSFADGHSVKRFVYADGTYVDNDSIPLPTGGVAYAIIQENSDGSGSYTAPFAGGNVSSVSVSAPALPTPVPTGTPNPITTPQVTVTLKLAGFYASILGPTISAQFTPFYVYTPKPVFYSETDAVNTAGSFPAGCANSYGASGLELVRKIATLDTVLGYVETTEFDAYAAAGYPVCVVSSDVINYAYDYAGDTVGGLGGFLFGQLGGRITTTSQTLVLQPGATGVYPSSTTRQPSSVGGAPPIASSVFAGIESATLQTYAVRRNAIIRAYALSTHSLPNGGGK